MVTTERSVFGIVGKIRGSEVIEDIRARLQGFEEVCRWPLLVELIERPVREDASPCWGYPLYGCRAVGGDGRAAFPGCAAIFCLFYSIHLVDDLLDEDPRGLQNRVGAGAAANAAAAFQGLAALVLEDADLRAESRRRALQIVSQAALATAFGQQLDVSNPDGEEAYWEVVRRKTPPLFGCSLELGALLGAASLETAAKIGALGANLGEIVQISDDLGDALGGPMKPDWQGKGTNLPILFARTAEHSEGERFETLMAGFRNGEADDCEALKEAQAILVRSGAVSYCVYRMLQSYHAALETLGRSRLPDPKPLERLFELQVEPVQDLLKLAGVEEGTLMAPLPPPGRGDHSSREISSGSDSSS